LIAVFVFVLEPFVSLFTLSILHCCTLPGRGMPLHSSDEQHGNDASIDGKDDYLDERLIFTSNDESLYLNDRVRAIARFPPRRGKSFIPALVVMTAAIECFGVFDFICPLELRIPVLRFRLIELLHFVLFGWAVAPDWCKLFLSS
jgi:hypothetical protein